VAIRILFVSLLLTGLGAAQPAVRGIGEPQPAAARLQQQVESAALNNAPSKGAATFVEIALPRDLDEYIALRKGAVLIVSVFAGESEATEIKQAHFIEKSGSRSALALNRIVKRPTAENPLVLKVLGMHRANYFYLLPESALAGGRLEIEFHYGTPVFQQELPPAANPFANAPVPEMKPSFVKGLQALAKREFPEFPFPIRVRISQGVAQGNLVKQVRPLYPAQAKANWTSGSVVLVAVIGQDGQMKDIRLISGHRDLVPSAYEAVKQWVYRPYLLDGEPVEVETQITINFALN
jgi:TonB family protein